MWKSLIRISLWSLVVVLALTASATAQQPKEQPKYSDEAERAARAAGVLNEIMGLICYELERLFRCYFFQPDQLVA
jgi:hypothetical protein